MSRVSFSRSLENNCWMDYTRHGIISSTTIYYKWLILSLLSLSLTNIILLKDALCDKIANIWKIICCIKNSDQTFFPIIRYVSKSKTLRETTGHAMLVSIPHTPHFSLSRMTAHWAFLVRIFIPKILEYQKFLHTWMTKSICSKSSWKQRTWKHTRQFTGNRKSLLRELQNSTFSKNL